MEHSYMCEPQMTSIFETGSLVVLRLHEKCRPAGQPVSYRIHLSVFHLVMTGLPGVCHHSQLLMCIQGTRNQALTLTRVFLPSHLPSFYFPDAVLQVSPFLMSTNNTAVVNCTCQGNEPSYCLGDTWWRTSSENLLPPSYHVDRASQQSTAVGPSIRERRLRASSWRHSHFTTSTPYLTKCCPRRCSEDKCQFGEICFCAL